VTEPVSPIVITGGAQRLGLAAALALHRQNYPVVITYRKQRPLLRELEAQGIETIRADFSDEQGVTGLAEELCSRYPSLRAIIHNASEWMAEGGEEGDLLRRHGELHGQADIIHMSDYVAGSGSKKHIAYAASKAALHNLTLSFASKFAPLVKVNSIAPALLMFNHDDDAAYREKALRKSLLGIAPGEAEAVNAIRYILESRFLTGKTIALDGGRHLAQAS
jgi:dihydromonapterin reductase/dihydrofolate reductase